MNDRLFTPAHNVIKSLVTIDQMYHYNGHPIWPMHSKHGCNLPPI